MKRQQISSPREVINAASNDLKFEPNTPGRVLSSGKITRSKDLESAKELNLLRGDVGGPEPTKASETDFDKELAMKQVNEIAMAEFNQAYSPSIIYSLFALVFITNVLINVDHGTLPGCTKEIETKLDINDFGFGILGSIVYAGLTLGAVFATMIFSMGPWIKPTLAFTLLMNALCLYAFTMSNSFLITACIRTMIGFFQVFPVIYMPVWADAYGTEKQKSIWLTVLLLASPVGVVMGYTLTFYMIKHLTWEWSFYIQAMAIIPCSLCILITPNKYIDIEYTV